MNGEKASVVGVCVGAGAGGSNERGDRVTEERGQNRWRRALGAIERLGFLLRTKWELLESFRSNYLSYSRNSSLLPHTHLSISLSPPVGWKSLEDPVSPSYLPLSAEPAMPRTFWVLNKQ